MPLVTFMYYLPDRSSQSEMLEKIEDQIGEHIPADLAEKIGRPFYEVSLSCILNTDTGEVFILSAQG